MAVRAEAQPLQGVAVERHSPGQAAMRRFMRHRLAVVGIVLLTIIVLLAIFADVVSSQPFRTDVRAVSQPPSAEHPLGTDRSGRDVWARVVHGARTSLVVGLGAGAIYVVIGTVLGGIAGVRGGRTDFIIMRAVDTLMSIPTLLLVIVFVAAVGPSLFSVLVVIGLLGWPGACRLVRGQMLGLRESEYIMAARDPLSTSPPEHHELARRPGHVRGRERDHPRGWPVVPRAGCQGARAELGRDDQRGTIADRPHRHAMAVDLAGRRDRAHRPVGQLHW